MSIMKKLTTYFLSQGNCHDNVVELQSSKVKNNIFGSNPLPL